MSDAAELRALLLADRSCRRNGIDLVEVREGGAVVTMTVSEEQLNPFGVLHAGHLFLLADVALGMAAADPERPAVSVGGSLSLLSPARAGDVLRADAQLRVRSGRTGLYDVSVFRTGGDERVAIAEFRGQTLRTGAR